MNTAALNALLMKLDREIWLLTAASGPRRGGLIATFVSTASIVPEMPRMVVGLAKQHHTWSLVETSGAFALHLLGEEHLDLAWRFGLTSGRTADKLAGLTWHAGASGSPVLASVGAWLDCRVEARLDTGDRTIYLAEVLASHLTGLTPPLTVQRLLQLTPADKLKELKEQLTRDAAIDAAAIHAWRKCRTGRPA